MQAVLHVLHVRISYFTFHSRSRLFHDVKLNDLIVVVCTTRAPDDKHPFDCADFNLIPGYLKTDFASIMTWKNWKIIAET